MKKFLTLISVVLISISTLSSSTSSGGSTIKGKVTYNNNIVVGATVNLYNLTNQLLGYCQSDNNGEYRFHNVPSGIYFVYGFIPANEIQYACNQRVIITSDGTTIIQDLKLQTK